MNDLTDQEKNLISYGLLKAQESALAKFISEGPSKSIKSIVLKLGLNNWNLDELDKAIEKES